MSKSPSFSLAKLLRLLKAYDRANGPYPEHEFEGKAVAAFILHQLGYTEKMIVRRLKIDRYDYKYFENLEGLK
jgi:hypothetical protein